MHLAIQLHSCKSVNKLTYLLTYLLTHFQTKMSKYENRSLCKMVNPIKPKFEHKAETTTCTSWVGYHHGGAEIARVDNAAADKSTRRNRGGQRRSGQQSSEA